MVGALSGESFEVTVRLFAVLRERAGGSELTLALEPGATVDDALLALSREPGLDGGLLERLPVRMAVNRDYAAGDTVLHEGDELALIPPVSGGALAASGGAVHARISAEPLSLQRVRALVSDPAAGAIVVFEGVTREIAALDYEAYEEMARERIESILMACAERHGLRAAAAEHRVGSVPLGEPSVIVAVSAPHREEAFAGAREAIDEIKAQAPIWKREEGDGGRWVDGTLPGGAP